MEATLKLHTVGAPFPRGTAAQLAKRTVLDCFRWASAATAPAKLQQGCCRLSEARLAMRMPLGTATLATSELQTSKQPRRVQQQSLMIQLQSRSAWTASVKRSEFAERINWRGAQRLRRPPRADKKTEGTSPYWGNSSRYALLTNERLAPNRYGYFSVGMEAYSRERSSRLEHRRIAQPARRKLFHPILSHDRKTRADYVAVSDLCSPKKVVRFVRNLERWDADRQEPIRNQPIKYKRCGEPPSFQLFGVKPAIMIGGIHTSLTAHRR